MKLVLIISLLFLSLSASALSNKLTVVEANSISVFVSKVDETLISADACVTELDKDKQQGVECKAYGKKIAELNKVYRKVKQIERKKRHRAIADNDVWYNAFRTYDKVGFVVKEINKKLMALFASYNKIN